MLYCMNCLTYEFGIRTGGWEFDRSHGAGTSYPSILPYWQQVEEQAPKPVGWCVSSWWALFTSRSSLCYIYIYVNIYIYLYIYIYIRMHYLYKFCYRTYIDIQQECRSVLVTFVFVLNIILTLGIWRSAISHLPGWFCHWTFFQNVAFNMVPLDTYYVTFSYSTWIFCWLSLRRMLSWINH